MMLEWFVLLLKHAPNKDFSEQIYQIVLLYCLLKKILGTLEHIPVHKTVVFNLAKYNYDLSKLTTSIVPPTHSP